MSYNYDEIIKGIEQGNRKSIAKALTIVEQQNLNLKDLLSFLSVLPVGKKTIRIAVTGSPGVGKSSFIEKLGNSFLENGKKVAVIAIDPSSHHNKGSILGDKTRMPLLSASSEAFIRPSPNVGESGGIRNSVFNSIKIFEAAGYEVIIIESVGVGQSEVAVKMISDFFVLLLEPGGGDELQGIKKGIVEVADMILINKYDGNLKSLAEKTYSDYKNAIHLSNYQSAFFDQIPLVKVSSIEGSGIEEVYSLLVTLLENEVYRKRINELRKDQEARWIEEQLKDYIIKMIMNKLEFKDMISKKETENPKETNIYKILINVIHKVESKIEL